MTSVTGQSLYEQHANPDGSGCCARDRPLPGPVPESESRRASTRPKLETKEATACAKVLQVQNRQKAANVPGLESISTEEVFEHLTAAGGQDADPFALPDLLHHAKGQCWRLRAIQRFADWRSTCAREARVSSWSANYFLML